jgi:hypothetical protein
VAVARWYFPSANNTFPPPVTGVAVDSGWTYANPTGFLRAQLLPALNASDTPDGASQAESGANFAETQTVAGNQCHRQYISESIGAQTISGTFSAVFRIGESAAAADAALQVIVRVLSHDGTTVRGVLYAGQSASLNTTAGALGQECNTTAETRLIPSGTALSSVTAQDGDRLCVEVGARYYNTSATSFNTFVRYGADAGLTDLAFSAGSTTDGAPWIEFSTAITLLDAAASPSVTASLSPTAAVTANASASLAVTDSVSAAAAVTANAAGSLAATGGITATGLATANAAAGPTVTADLSATAAATHPTTATVNASAGLTASAGNDAAAAAALAGTADWVATTSLIRVADAALAVTGSVTADATVVGIGALAASSTAPTFTPADTATAKLAGSSSRGGPG